MDLNKLTKKELVDYADSQGISVNIKDTKEFLISKIKTLDKWRDMNIKDYIPEVAEAYGL